jgi:hypothetical protein
MGASPLAGAAPGDGEEHLLQIAAAEAGDQRLRRLVGDDAAFLQHDHALGHPLDLRHVVRGEHHGGGADPAVILELGAHPVRRIGIERGGGLVEQQQLGLVDERLGEADARLLPG